MCFRACPHLVLNPWFLKLKALFQVVLHDSEHEKVYATGGQTQVPVFITGMIKVDNAEIVVLDSDLGSVESQKKWVFV